MPDNNNDTPRTVYAVRADLEGIKTLLERLTREVLELKREIKEDVSSLTSDMTNVKVKLATIDTWRTAHEENLKRQSDTVSKNEEELRELQRVRWYIAGIAAVVIGLGGVLIGKL